MKPFSTLFWAVLAIGVVLFLLMIKDLDYREARILKIVFGVILGSFLFWLKGRSQRSSR